MRLGDGYNLFVEDVGQGYPIVCLHGGPGCDHTMFRPYLDPLADEFRLLYVDERGQGRSDRVDPETLSVEVFARDVDLLADALGLDEFALLGHSFGAIIAAWHATELGTAAAYVISAGTDSSAALETDVEQNLAACDDPSGNIARSWELEKSVATEAEFAQLMDMQAPWHFHGAPQPDAFRDTVYAPAVLRHFANIGYGDFDYTPKLAQVDKPALILVGEHDRTTTPRAARVLHEQIPNSELVVILGAGHMSYIENPDTYLPAVRRFLGRVAGS